MCVCVNTASDRRFCLTGVHGQKEQHRPKKQLKSTKSNVRLGKHKQEKRLNCSWISGNLILTCGLTLRVL